MADESSYIIRGGPEGRERLRVVARVMAPTTTELLDRVGVTEDAACLDVGCGGGDVALELARRVPRGRVVGIDIDETKLEIARAEARAGIERLTVREREVLGALARGGSTVDVADEYGISRLTVQSHVKSILAKLGVHSKVEAVTLAWRHGLAPASRSA